MLTPVLKPGDNDASASAGRHNEARCKCVNTYTVKLFSLDEDEPLKTVKMANPRAFSRT